MGIGHHHNQDSPGFATLRPAIGVALCMALAATGILPGVAGVSLYAVAAALGSLPILVAALKGLLRLRLSADLAVLLAAGAAIAIGEPFVAAEVILIMLVGGLLEDVAVRHTRGAIRALMDLAPVEATVLRNGERVRVAVDEVAPGDRVVAVPGERLPVDGRVVDGHSSVDKSALTGESLPEDVGPGSGVLAGSVNGAGVLEIEALKVGDETAFGRMVHLVEEAEARKAPAQRLADRYATFFLPVVLAAALAAWYFSGDIVRAVAVLVIACPCALVLATPTAVSAGIGRLARRGILAKGGAALEALGRCRMLLLDKTGTLTLARLSVSDLLPADGVSETDLLAAAAAVEVGSEHPLGKAVMHRARHDRIDPAPATGLHAVPGKGMAGTVAGAPVRVGSEAFLREAGVSIPGALAGRAVDLRAAGKSLVFVARGTGFLGIIAARDEAREEAGHALAELRGLFPKGLVMLTGDSAGAARALGDELGIDDIRSELLPEDKSRIVAELSAHSGPVAMVGDGVNDAAALALADVGIALTDVGTDAAIEAAGIAVFGDRHLEKLPEAVRFSRRVLRTIRQNIILFALAFNAAGVLVAAFGVLGPVSAALMHQVGSLFVVANSLRLLWSRRELAERAGSGMRGAGRFAWSLRRPVCAGAAAATILSGTYFVRPDEVGLVRVFGKLRGESGPGIHWSLPFPASRLTRVRVGRIGRVEVGFRTAPETVSATIPAYEWSLQHREGRYRMVPEESLMTCGDQSFLDVNAVLHYRITDAARFAFASADPDAVVRTVGENSLREVIASLDLRAVLTDGRAAIESSALTRVRERLGPYGLGVEITALYLQDVHPPLEAVDAFRRVVDALEEKDALVNRAQAYANERVPLARGAAATVTATADSEFAEKTGRAAGEAAAFRSVSSARRSSPGGAQVNDFRLYADAIETVLGRVRLTLVQEGLPVRSGMVLLGRGAGAMPPALSTLTETEGAPPPERGVEP